MFLFFWHCDVHHNDGLLLVIDQHDVKPIVMQMPASLDEEVLEDFNMIGPYYFFMYHSTHQS